MDKSKRVLNLSHDDIETFQKKDFEGYAAIDVTEYCFGELIELNYELLKTVNSLGADFESRVNKNIGNVEVTCTDAAEEAEHHIVT